MIRTTDLPSISSIASRHRSSGAHAWPQRAGVWLLLSGLLALGACKATPAGPGEEAAVMQALTAACRAYLEADTERMAFLLTEDFTTTDPDGVVTTRADDIENARKGTIRYDVFENRDMKVRLHGSAAIVTGRTIVRGTAGDRPFDAEFQFTDTLVKRAGQWRVAATHISRISR